MAGESDALVAEAAVLLACDAMDSTQFREPEPGRLMERIAQVDRILDDAAAHGGVRLVDRRNHDRFVFTFTDAADAIACAIALQRAPLAPIRLRIAVDTGEVTSSVYGEYPGPAIARAGELCDVAHWGQTLVSQEAEQLVADRLTADAWLTDLGVLSRGRHPRRVAQLCHRDLVNDFPPPRTATDAW